MKIIPSAANLPLEDGIVFSIPRSGASQDILFRTLSRAGLETSVSVDLDGRHRVDNVYVYPKSGTARVFSGYNGISASRYTVCRCTGVSEFNNVFEEVLAI